MLAYPISLVSKLLGNRPLIPCFILVISCIPCHAQRRTPLSLEEDFDVLPVLEGGEERSFSRLIAAPSEVAFVPFSAFCSRRYPDEFDNLAYLVDVVKPSLIDGLGVHRH